MRGELPIIQYANPTLPIKVNKVPKSEADTWQSSLLMEFGESLRFLRFLSLDVERLFRGRVEEIVHHGR